MTLAGFKPAGVLCELTNDDGTMARAPECIEFANKHNMALVTIEDLVAYRQAHGSVKPAENRCLIYCLNQKRSCSRLRFYFSLLCKMLIPLLFL